MNINSNLHWRQLFNEQIKYAIENINETEGGEDWTAEELNNQSSSLNLKGFTKSWFISECKKASKLVSRNFISLSIDILTILRSPEQDVGNQLVDLVGYSSLEFITQLTIFRSDIVNSILEEASQSALEVKTANENYNESKKSTPIYGAQITIVTQQEKDDAKQLRKDRKKTGESMDSNVTPMDSAILLGFEGDYLRILREQQLLGGSLTSDKFNEYSSPMLEVYPNVYQSSKTTAISAFSNKYILPEGTTRDDNADREEITIPIAVPAPVRTTEEKVNIEMFEEWIRPTFKGYTSLNRVQSIVYPIAFQSNENMLVCAPTGAGKTDIAMLTILRIISQHRINSIISLDEFKIVYVAPMKALAAEVVQKFSKRLKYLGIQVRELTGDMQLTKAEINDTQIIITTPEKWDVVTRKSVGDTQLVQKVKLLILDEVHLLHEGRGSVIETLVARTLRMVESSQFMIRIVGLSATLPNYVDVASFLGVNFYQGLFYFDGGFRPVPLEQHLVGIKGKPGSIVHKTKEDTVCFDIVSEMVQNGHQVLVFVHSRKNTVITCKTLLEEAKNSGKESLFDSTQHDQYNLALREVQKSRNKEMKDFFPFGLGFHHAGMLRSDRNIMEKMFSNGVLRVLCTTATLAWGVNLPAYCVVIKGTQVYNAEKGEFADLSVLDVLQIFGRAGRPQFEDRGVAYLLTAHERLNHYVDSLCHQHPIESTFAENLTNNLNAEISLGTITNMTEAVKWLSYTYLYTRMKKNPFNYGLDWQDLTNDPMLVTRRTDLITIAARKLHRAQMVVFDETTGFLTSKDLGRISSNYYIDYRTIEIVNSMMRPTMTEADCLSMLSMSTEFENLKVREEEMREMKNLLDRECVCAVKGGIETNYGKANILIQSYISNSFIEDFALVSDSNYVSKNSSRILRALFEISMSRNWGPTSSTLLSLCKAVEKRMWPFEHPLLQFKIPFEIQEKIHKLRLDTDIDSLREMTAKDLGILVRFQKAGEDLRKFIWQFPILRMEADIFPITRSILRITLRVNCDFNWNERAHGLAERFHLWVEDSENIEVLYSDQIIITKKQYRETLVFGFVVPIPFSANSADGIPPQIFIRLTSERWIGSETILPISFKNLVLPMTDRSRHTDLLALQPLPINALQDEILESICAKRFEYFNPVQTQVFHTLYYTNHNVLLGAPTGSGKTVVAELAMWANFRDFPKSKVIYIAPLKALVRERVADWKKRLMPMMGRTLVELTGDVSPDIRAIESADVIITTPEKWDGVSRQWKSRKYVREVGCIIIDEIHLLGADRGPILEVIVSRMHFISSKIERKIRLVGLSTALANAGDLADWLGIGNVGLFNFRHSVRPVPLEIYIEGYPGQHYCPRMISMNRPAFAAILKHSPSKPVLVFVSSRRQTRLTARDFIALCGADDNPRKFLHMSEDELEPLLNRVVDQSLKMALQFGIGLHHAGLVESDRDLVEQLFCSGMIQILIATSTLAWGVNFPAHLVVIKGTEFYDAKIKGYKDFPITDVLQMMGRAGRPQYDDSGCAVVLVHDIKKDFYKKFLHEPFPVESSLHECLSDHLNAEISSQSISTMQDAMDYISWTFLYRRMAANPSYYGSESASEKDINTRLSQLIETSLIELEESGCVEFSLENTVKSTLLGRISSHYYLSHFTIRSFVKNLKRDYDSPTEKPNFASLLRVLASAHEYSEFPVRHNEDIQNRELEVQLDVPLNPKGIATRMEYDSPHAKAFLLLQSHLCRIDKLPVADYVTDTKTVLDQSIRVTQAMIDCASLNGYLRLCKAILCILKSLQQAMWPCDSSILMLPHIQESDLDKLRIAEVPIEQIKQLLSLDKMELKKVFQPLGLPNAKLQDIQRVLSELPLIKVSATIKNITPKFNSFYVKSSTSYLISITIANERRYDGYIFSRFPKKQKGQWFLLVGDPQKDELFVCKRISSFHTIEIPILTSEYVGEYQYEVSIVSDSYYGVDCRHTLSVIVS